MQARFLLLIILHCSLTWAGSPYQRSAFKHWIDADKDCQNTRAEVLIATSIEDVGFSDSKQCVVKSGFWVDPYSGRAFTSARELDIDHIIPLKYAFENGAEHWPNDKRTQFANDPANTIAVNKSLNRQKGAKPPSEWLPPNKAFVCDYIARWVSVAAKYNISTDVKISNYASCVKVERGLSSSK